MWYFTPLGFFSVVKHTGLPDHLLIRSRDRAHLEKLQRAFPRELATSPIIETPKNDYPYRIIVPRLDWVSVAMNLAAKIDYPNFKSESEIVAEGTASGDRYLVTLHKVWSLLDEEYRSMRPAVKTGN